ncbi:MAG: chemotaxis protein CheW [Terrisporobacter othiniensis]|uniref:Chemotaxis protein CheW n=1 Tax=Terrisporobacter hibernicus TaxID=2813371 RepID=A0AAX2ZI74_9FIRM|nr:MULTISPECIES: chemotaxis protein CheW [Terrisporobacter]MDU4860390.1 chemotaxis protein CheW [Terrisporobacter othiniensis]MDU6993381.1 chemotaxis protein CheW [Terrisporobacter othiniensis]UEL48536.1 chemotaxis protein CheW [Terrisporobacter hibernicus]
MYANDVESENRIDDLYMVFVVNNQKYALSSKYIIEIIEMLPITKVPFLPKYMKGIINLRSTIIPVMDARMRFDIEPINYDERTCIIIIENNDNKIGLIVDTVNEVIHISPEQNMNMDSSQDDGKSNFIKSVSEINNDVQLILDCDSLMKIVEENNYAVEG